MPRLNKMRIRLAISTEEFEAYYRGEVRYVVTRAFDGRTIRFPANIIRPFLTHDGIYGEFVISFDDENRFQKIERAR